MTAEEATEQERQRCAEIIRGALRSPANSLSDAANAIAMGWTVEHFYRVCPRCRPSQG